MSVINFGELLVTFYSNFSSLQLSFPSSLRFQLHMYIWYLPMALGFSNSCVFWWFHYFLFSIVLLTYLQAHWFFPWPCPVYWWVHSSFLLVFLVSRILFWFFLRVYGFAYITHLFLNVVWFFLLITFNILIINYLTFLCDNSKICAISEFSFDAYFVSSDCLFLVY